MDGHVNVHVNVHILDDIPIIGIYAIVAGPIDVNTIIAGFYYELHEDVWYNRPHALYGIPIIHHTRDSMTRRQTNDLLMQIELTHGEALYDQMYAHVCRHLPIRTGAFISYRKESRSHDYMILCTTCYAHFATGFVRI
jgi:hypothetical protein